MGNIFFLSVSSFCCLWVGFLWVVYFGGSTPFMGSIIFFLGATIFDFWLLHGQFRSSSAIMYKLVMAVSLLSVLLIMCYLIICGSALIICQCFDHVPLLYVPLLYVPLLDHVPVLWSCASALIMDALEILCVIHICTVFCNFSQLLMLYSYAIILYIYFVL